MKDKPIVGIDVSKGWLDLCIAGNAKVERLANDAKAIGAWLDRVRPAAASPRANRRLRAGAGRGGAGDAILFVRVHPNDVIAFRKSRGIKAKTDRIDAQLIAAFAAEELVRRNRPAVSHPPPAGPGRPALPAEQCPPCRALPPRAGHRKARATEPGTHHCQPCQEPRRHRGRYRQGYRPRSPNRSACQALAQRPGHRPHHRRHPHRRPSRARPPLRQRDRLPRRIRPKHPTKRQSQLPRTHRPWPPSRPSGSSSTPPAPPCAIPRPSRTSPTGS